MRIKVDFEFFGTPAGSEYELIEDSYAGCVCDCCGIYRQCDYYVHESNRPFDSTFLDLCRKCRKEHAKVIE